MQSQRCRIYSTQVRKSELQVASPIYVFLSFSFVAVPIVAVDGVVGNKVQLPCDISFPDNDEVSMVLWYKEGGGEPIYR